MISKDEFTKRVAQNVKREREREQISQEELADKAGLYRTYVGHIENARYSPSAYVLYKLSQALKTNINKLIKP